MLKKFFKAAQALPLGKKLLDKKRRQYPVLVETPTL
jgi:hypothetical protein